MACAEAGWHRREMQTSAITESPVRVMRAKAGRCAKRDRAVEIEACTGLTSACLRRTQCIVDLTIQPMTPVLSWP